MHAAGYFVFILMLKNIRGVFLDHQLGFETYDRCDVQCMRCMKDHGYGFYGARFWDQVNHFDPTVSANMKDAHRTKLGKNCGA